MMMKVIVVCVAVITTLLPTITAQGDVTVTFQAPPTRQTSAGSQMVLPAGLMTTRNDWMPIVCQGLPRDVVGCNGVLSFDAYLSANYARFFGTSGRKKRGAHYSSPFWSNPSWNSWSSWDPWPSNSWNSGGGGHHSNNPSGNTNTRPSTTTAVICPSQANQSALYQLSGNSAGYPAADVGTAIANNPVLAGCLAQEIVLDTLGPQVIVEASQAAAVPTCPFSTRRLWQYQSLQQGQTCWVLQNFGDFYLYTECTSRFCYNCTDTPTTSGSSWYPSTTTSLNQKLCLTTYRAVSIWAYCPNNLPVLQIVRDRIIIPVACACNSVRCEAAPPG